MLVGPQFKINDGNTTESKARIYGSVGELLVGILMPRSVGDLLTDRKRTDHNNHSRLRQEPRSERTDGHEGAFFQAIDERLGKTVSTSQG